ncbi:HAD family hydrolase [Haloplanus halophilus]|uniref:HAD family hydrolase n=1 Tax=Haloplanus halophilus TaxID=2949993 RepID=UPI00203AEE1C|nr:HAD-IA family hydrolase [Haloplanus sp. GDY1]
MTPSTSAPDDAAPDDAAPDDAAPDDAAPDDAAHDDPPILLFDMDGVLVEGRGTDETVHERALDDAIAERGLDVDPETRALLSGYEYDADFARGCARLGVDPVAFYGLRERHGERRVIDRLESGVRTLYPDATVVQELAERYTVGVVSNNYDGVVRFVVDHHGLDAFAHVRGRDTGVRGFYRRKPDPHYLLDALDSLGGADGCYVGDRGTDLLAATRAGLDPVLVRRPHNDGLVPPVEPTVEVDSLSALADRL